MDGQFDDAPDELPTALKAKLVGHGVTVLSSMPLVSIRTSVAAAAQSPAKDAEEVKGEAEGDYDYGEDDLDDGPDYDDHAGVGGGARGGGGNARALEQHLGGKMNLSQRTSNEMASAESLAGRRANHTGRDDRATSEQVSCSTTPLTKETTVHGFPQNKPRIGVIGFSCECRSSSCGDLIGCHGQVMDPRTRLMLFKLLNSGFLSEIDGCLSTGE